MHYVALLKIQLSFNITIKDGEWFCCKECYIASSKKSEPQEDGDKNYVPALMFVGLTYLIHHDAVRENDGHAMMSHWKLEIIFFPTNIIPI